MRILKGHAGNAYESRASQMTLGKGAAEGKLEYHGKSLQP